MIPSGFGLAHEKSAHKPRMSFWPDARFTRRDQPQSANSNRKPWAVDCVRWHRVYRDSGLVRKMAMHLSVCAVAVNLSFSRRSASRPTNARTDPPPSNCIKRSQLMSCAIPLRIIVISRDCAGGNSSPSNAWRSAAFTLCRASKYGGDGQLKDSFMAFVGWLK